MFTNFPLPINYWIIEVFSVEISPGNSFDLLPDLHSYIVYSPGKKNKKISLYKPLTSSINFSVKQKEQKHYFAKCRPAYIGYLQELISDKHRANLFKSLKKPEDFLILLDSQPFRNITPTLLDSVVFHILQTNGKTTFNKLKKRYLCSNKVLTTNFKNNLGMTLETYKTIC